MPGWFGGYTQPRPIQPLQSGSAGSGRIGDAAVTSGNIASGAVGWPHLGSGAILSGHIASGQLGGNHFGSGAILSGFVASGQLGINHHSSGMVMSLVCQSGIATNIRTVSDAVASNSGLIVTVSGTGLYRVTSYLNIVQGVAGNGGTALLRLDWTDDSRAQSANVIPTLALNVSGLFAQATSTLRILSGTLVMATVTLSDATGPPHYNAFAALERII